MENNIPNFNPDDLNCFVILCDNEVVSYINFSKEDEMHTAIYNSEPKFIQVEFTKRPPIGALWDGKEFKVQDWQ